MQLPELIRDIGRRAREASRSLSTLTTETKNAILRAMADELLARESAILDANAADVTGASAHGLAPAALDRLRLTPERLRAIAAGVRHVAELPDPVNEVLAEWTRPNGIRISKVRKPIGVIGIIYESRPNVTSDAAVLCIKTGNAVILRGGSESLRSNLAIAEALQAGGARAGLPADAVQLIPVADREAVKLMARMDDCIDVLVPRGGKSLIEAVVSTARMPVIKHYDGVCHIYVDAAADLEMAARILVNAKCQRPGVCNSAECVLVHRDIAAAFFQTVAPQLEAHGVELRADEASFVQLSALDYRPLARATEEDYRTEYLALILSVRIVSGVAEAIDHIERHGSHHSDAIVTSDEGAAERFLNEVDSATVYWNASTRFTDGGEFGFGAEIGISTDKLHARGPMALPELTTYRYLIRGEGQIRE
ncbi:MAG: glutamate-5-semialdehyde dehydrogenase [Terrimicrobiaceae bacterium]|nr:glutamate-5-semialdehyde dehydrogenase [Terrimicrobiaceae bacterium]